MRDSYWLVGAGLLCVALAFAFWPAASYRQSPSPPGQYPLENRRPQWSATESTGLYRPRGSGYQDALMRTGFMDAKMSCGGDRFNKICTLPTVRYISPYEPTILMRG